MRSDRGWRPPVLLLLLAGCGGAAARPRAAPPATPASPDALRTTDGAIATANFEGQLRALEEAVAHGREDKTPALVAALLAHARWFGRLDSLSRAARLAEGRLASHPADPDAWLVRARVHGALHLFPAALSDLDGAAHRGASADEVDDVRAGVLQALGRLDEALALRRRVAERRPGIDSLGGLAATLAETGDFQDAARTFVRAQDAFGGVSPFPLAWLWFQEGRMWMDAGRPERARELFAAAHERLPRYAAAAGHLGEVEARLGRTADAIRHLRLAAAGSDDPDPAGQLARVLAAAGHPAEAAQWRAQAAARFEELMARHPEAFADHAAEFWLGAGADPMRALACARRNVVARPTPRSFELLLEAARAAGDTSEACHAVRALEVAPRLVPAHPPGVRNVLAICPS